MNKNNSRKMKQTAIYMLGSVGLPVISTIACSNYYIDKFSEIFILFYYYFSHYSTRF